jgi:hypothetical protein
MITIQTSVSKGWLHREMGIKFEDSYYFDPHYRLKQDLQTAEFLEERFPRYRIHNLESNLVNLNHYSPRQIMVGAIQPNLIVGMLLGAKFIAYPDQDADISEKPLAGLTDIADLPSPDSLPENPILKDWLRAVSRLQDSPIANREWSVVVPPFFWDAGSRAVIHGSLTTALKFFGHELLLKIFDEPDFITDFFLWYESACRVLTAASAGAAKKTISDLHVGECSGTMVGPEEYKQFIIPSLDRLSRTIAPIRLHHCGSCTHLLPYIRKFENLASLDTGDGTSVADIRALWGRDLPIDLMPPIELLLEGAPAEQLSQWLEQVLAENQEGELTINYHLEPGYDAENHLFLHEMLYERKLLAPGRL